MFNFANSLRIYLCVNPTDMRKSFNGLYRIARHGGVFVFLNRRRDRLKLLYWDGTGFWVLAKRLEKGTFWWPPASELGSDGGGALEIKPEALSMLLNGIDLKAGSLRPWFCR